MYVTVHFDVEDYVYAPEEGIDEVPKWIAETMTEVGVRGVFHILGDKARALRERGRADVAAALAPATRSHMTWAATPTATPTRSSPRWSSTTTGRPATRSHRRG